MVEHGAISKTRTFVDGIDEVLHGGVPEGRTTLVVGAAGTGKTILGLEFLARGAIAGEPGILLCFEERADQVRAHARALGWDFAALEAEGKLYLLDGHLDADTVVAGDFSIGGLLAMVKAVAASTGARRVVVDAIDVLLSELDDPGRERRELMALHRFMAELGLTTLLTAKAVVGQAPRYEFLDFTVDCIIRLEEDRARRRQLRVAKYRGSSHARVGHPYVITGKGLRLLPSLSLDVRPKLPDELISFGSAALDAILGGGVWRGGSVLIGGASGTGKTTLCASFVRAACARGEKVLYIGFEESPDALVRNMLGSGVDLQPAVDAGQLELMTRIPEALGLEEHLHEAFAAIEAFDPEHVVVDSVSSCRRMGSAELAGQYVTRMLVRCLEQGRTLVMARQTLGSSFEEAIDIDAVAMVDTIIVLAYASHGVELGRKLLVVKARALGHSRLGHAFHITDEGLVLELLSAGARREHELER